MPVSERDAAEELAYAVGLGHACVLLYDPSGGRPPRTPGFAMRTHHGAPPGAFVLVLGSVTAPVMVEVPYGPGGDDGAKGRWDREWSDGVVGPGGAEFAASLARILLAAEVMLE